MSTSSTNTKLVLTGDSIIANFDKFFLSFGTLNFVISGDKIQNILWYVCNITFPASVEYFIIHCGTNNLGHNTPLKIAKRLIEIARCRLQYGKYFPCFSYFAIYFTSL